MHICACMRSTDQWKSMWGSTLLKRAQVLKSLTTYFPFLYRHEASTPTHKIKKYIVYESCIVELFAGCPVCTRVCDVKTRKLGTFLSVEQLCPHCEFYRYWNSQPVIGGTPAGNLHLSAAVYLSGASFFKIEKVNDEHLHCLWLSECGADQKVNSDQIAGTYYRTFVVYFCYQQVFKAMQLQLCQCDTFCRHARAFTQPAVVHHWKTFQDIMLQRLSQEDKVIVSGDMRADSLGSYILLK